jgi:hypothetical protein
MISRSRAQAIVHGKAPERPDGIMSLRVVFENGHEEGYDIIPEDVYKSCNF